MGTANLPLFPFIPWASPPSEEGTTWASLSKVLVTSALVQHLLKVSKNKELPSLKAFKVELDEALSNLIW